jgi:hypothetical protein
LLKQTHKTKEPIPVTQLVGNCCCYLAKPTVKVSFYVHLRMQGVEDIEVVGASASNPSQHVEDIEEEDEDIDLDSD